MARKAGSKLIAINSYLVGVYAFKAFAKKQQLGVIDLPPICAASTTPKRNVACAGNDEPEYFSVNVADFACAVHVSINSLVI